MTPAESPQVDSFGFATVLQLQGFENNQPVTKMAGLPCNGLRTTIFNAFRQLADPWDKLVIPSKDQSGILRMPRLSAWLRTTWGPTHSVLTTFARVAASFRFRTPAPSRLA
jgi:hypothetical protein